MMPNGANIFVAVAQLSFVCPSCDVIGVTLPKPSDEQTTTPKTQKTESTAPSKPQKTANESINIQINELKNVLLAKFNDLKKTTTETNAIVKTLNELKQPHIPNTTRNITPVSTRTPRRQPLFSTMVKGSLQTASPSSTIINGKRKRDQLVMIENKTAKTVKQTKLPSPKIGKKSLQIGKPLVTLESKPQPRKFEKAVWVSKLHPETTVEEVSEYIINNTPLTDAKRFKCWKLVKKDKDISTLSFVSFKIDCYTEDLDILSDPQYWPKGNPVREFVKLEAPTLADFMPLSPPPKTARYKNSPAISPTQIHDSTSTVPNISMDVSISPSKNIDLTSPLNEAVNNFHQPPVSPSK